MNEIGQTGFFVFVLFLYCFCIVFVLFCVIVFFSRMFCKKEDTKERIDYDNFGEE